MDKKNTKLILSHHSVQPKDFSSSFSVVTILAHLCPMVTCTSLSAETPELMGKYVLDIHINPAETSEKNIKILMWITSLFFRKKTISTKLILHGDTRPEKVNIL